MKAAGFILVRLAASAVAVALIPLAVTLAVVAAIMEKGGEKWTG